jgi:hypothetical protein
MGRRPFRIAGPGGSVMPEKMAVLATVVVAFLNPEWAFVG